MLEIITSAVFLASTFYGTVDARTIPASVGNFSNQAVAEEVIELPAGSKLSQSMSLEKHVRSYFADRPLLAEIAACESRFRQFNKKGQALKGDYNKYDVGVMQINTLYHGEKAEELGLDLETLAGNLAYATYLYDKEGSTPWLSSSKCWQKSDKLALK